MVYVLHVIILLNPLNKLVNLSPSLRTNLHKLTVRNAGELGRNQLIAVILNILLNCIEGCELTVDYDFLLLVLVLLLEYLIHSEVYELKLKFLKVNGIVALDAEHRLVVEKVFHTA